MVRFRRGGIGAADQDVVVTVAGEPIVTAATINIVAAFEAAHLVVAGSGIDPVVAKAALHGVMPLSNYLDRIVRNPQLCGGEPVIKGTRVPVRTILASLAEGDCTDDILKDFPTLTEEDIRAVIAFAAASAEEDLPPMPLPRAS